jgi:hypothetical protein
MDGEFIDMVKKVANDKTDIDSYFEYLGLIHEKVGRVVHRMERGSILNLDAILLLER